MAKNKVSEWDTTASNNTDIAGINIAEGCAPSGINNAIREIMAQIKDMQTGADSDGLVVGGTFTASGGTVLSGTATVTASAPVVMSGTVTMNGNNNIGNTTSSTILSGTVTQTTSSKLYLDTAATTASAPSLSWSSDNTTGIYRPSSGVIAVSTGGTERVRFTSTGLVLGSGDATATTSSTILRAPNASGTNITGANFEIDAGNGTGTGGSGGIVVKTAAADSSGSTANTLTQRLYITPNGGISFGSTTTAYGTAGQVLKSNGDAPPSFGYASPTWVTEQSATGTNVDFTGIPSYVRRVTIVLYQVSLSGSALLKIRIGTGTSPDSTGYSYVAMRTAAGSTAGNVWTDGITINTNGSTQTISASITMYKITGNTWVINHIGGDTVGILAHQGGGYKSLSDSLGVIRVTNDSTNTFDSGTITVLYE